MNGACAREKDVVRAAVAGSWPEGLREHLLSCDECGAAASVAPWMDRLAAGDTREHALPAPAVVWMKAQLLRSTVTVDRAARPMHAFQMISYLVVAAGWAVVLMWKWTGIEQWAGRLSSTEILRGAAAGATVSTSSVLVFFMLVTATIVVAMQTILAEE